jgi:hypothetical protein
MYFPSQLANLQNETVIQQLGVTEELQKNAYTETVKYHPKNVIACNSPIFPCSFMPKPISAEKTILAFKNFR